MHDLLHNIRFDRLNQRKGRKVVLVERGLLVVHVGPGLGPLDLDLLVLHVDKVFGAGLRARRLLCEREEAEPAALLLLLQFQR